MRKMERAWAFLSNPSIKKYYKRIAKEALKNLNVKVLNEYLKRAPLEIFDLLGDLLVEKLKDLPLEVLKELDNLVILRKWQGTLYAALPNGRVIQEVGEIVPTYF